MKTYFDLLDETAERKALLETAEWEKDYEEFEETHFITEIDGEEYYKVVYADGSELITDDSAAVAGYAWEFDED